MTSSVARLNALFLLLVAGLIGCQRRPADTSAEPPAAAVSHPEERAVAEYAFYTGRTNAINSVTIQPRVTGYLVKMPFGEGEFVKKGQLLFEIDPRPYEAQLNAAQAQIESSKASLEFAHATYERFKELNKEKEGSVSKLDLDKYKAQEKQASAAVDLAKANLKSAELNLAWTKITAPIDGHISRFFLTEGNLVNQDVTQLTTLVSMDPMDVYFDIDEPTLLTLKRAVNEGKLKPRRKDHETYPFLGASTISLLAAPFARGELLASSMLYPGRLGPDAVVEMSLAGEDDFRHKGTINFVDNQVNPGTGSISVRGIFDNIKPPGGTYLMVPGMFVRVRLQIGEKRDELLVIDSAIVSEQNRKKVYVLDANNIVQDREVTVGSLQDDGLRVVRTGLTKEDWVLVGGLQQVRPRMKIEPERLKEMRVPGKAAALREPDTKKQTGKKK
jgi:multidrug efflux system membrane fusion protein